MQQQAIRIPTVAICQSIVVCKAAVVLRRCVRKAKWGVLINPTKSRCYMRHWCKNNAIMSIIIRTCGLGVYSDECCSCMLPIWWGFGQLWPVHVKKVAQIDGAEKFGPVISRIGGRGREEDIAVLLARFGEVLAAGCWGRVRLMVWGKKERARGGFVIHHEQHFFHAWCWLVILFTVIVANVAKTRFFCNNPCNKLLQKTVQDHHQRFNTIC